MKLSDIINEELIKRLHALTQKVVDKLNKFDTRVTDTNPYTIRMISSFIELITANPNYQEWILRQALINPEYFTTVDKNDLIKLLADFLRYQHQLPHPNINHYTIQELIKEIDELSRNDIGLPNTKLRVKDPLSLPGVTLEATKGDVKIYKITDPTSLAELGEGSKWCTRKSYTPCRAAAYLDKSPQIIVTHKNRLVAQFAENLSEIKDLENEPLALDQLKKLLPSSYIDKKINDGFVALGPPAKNGDFQNLSYMERTILAERIKIYGMMKEQADPKIISLIRQWPEKLVDYKLHHNVEFEPQELKYLVKIDASKAVKIAAQLVNASSEIESEMFRICTQLSSWNNSYIDSVKLYYKNHQWRLEQAKLITMELGVKTAARFAIEILKKPWPELEAKLATSVSGIIYNTSQNSLQLYTQYVIQAKQAQSLEYQQYVEEQLQSLTFYNHHTQYLNTVEEAIDYISALNIKNWTKPLEMLKQSKQELIQKWREIVDKDPSMANLNIIDRIVREASQIEEKYENILSGFWTQYRLDDHDQF